MQVVSLFAIFSESYCHKYNKLRARDSYPGQDCAIRLRFFASRYAPGQNSGKYYVKLLVGYSKSPFATWEAMKDLLEVDPLNTNFIYRGVIVTTNILLNLYDTKSKFARDVRLWMESNFPNTLLRVNVIRACIRMKTTVTLHTFLTDVGSDPRGLWKAIKFIRRDGFDYKPLSYSQRIVEHVKVIRLAGFISDELCVVLLLFAV